MRRGQDTGGLTAEPTLGTTVPFGHLCCLRKLASREQALRRVVEFSPHLGRRLKLNLALKQGPGVADWLRTPGSQHLRQEAVKSACVLITLVPKGFWGHQSAHSSKPNMLKVQIICRALVIHTYASICRKTMLIAKRLSNISEFCCKYLMYKFDHRVSIL